MRQFLLSTAFLLSAASASATEVLTIEEYLAVASGHDTTMSAEALDTYLAGVLDGVISLGDLAQSQGSPVFCLPDNPTERISVDNFKEALDQMFEQLEREIADFAERAQRSTMGRAAIQLFLFRFPCTEQQGG